MQLFVIWSLGVKLLCTRAKNNSKYFPIVVTSGFGPIPPQNFIDFTQIW